MSALTIILIAAVAMVALGVAAVAAWFFYTAYLTRLERRLAVRKGLYRDLVAGLATRERELLEPAIRQPSTLYDLEALEAVLEEQARNSTERPAWLLDAYDRLSLVDKYVERLRNARRWRERAFAAELLGRVGNAKAVPVLLDTVQATRTEDADVREIALRALARIADPRAVVPLITALQSAEGWLAPRIADILTRHGDQVVDPLIAFLEDGARHPARAWAANILGDVGAVRAFPVLVRSLGDLEDEVRAKAAAALGHLGDRRAVPYLLEHLLSDPAPFVRARIAGALGQFGDAEVVERLVRALGDPAWWVRMRSVEALEQIGQSAEGPLLVALDDPDPEIRSRSAVALERLGTPARIVGMIERDERADDARELLVKFAVAGARELLAELLAHRSPAVRLAVVDAVRRTGRADLGPELIGVAADDADPAVRADALDALLALGLRDAVPAAVTALTDGDERVRGAAIRLLAALGGPETARQLAARTADPEPGIRATAARALGGMRQPDVSSDLRPLLSDPEPAVRAAAALAAGDAGARALGDELVPLLDDADPAVRTAAAHSLGRIGPPGAVPALIRAFTDGDPTLREAIATAVVRLDPPRIRALIEILASGRDTASKRALIRTLAQVRTDAPLPLIAPLCRDPDPAVRAEAVAVAAGLGERAVPIAVAALEDPDDTVRARAVDALVRLELADQGDTLLRLLTEDPAAAVRERAALAIGLMRIPGGEAALLAVAAAPGPDAVRAAAVLALGAYEEESMVGPIAAMVDEAPVRAHLQARLRDDAEYRLLGQRLRRSRHLEFRALAAGSRDAMARELAAGVPATLEAPERIRLIAGLRALRGDQSREALLVMLRGDPSPEVRTVALHAVGATLEGAGLLDAVRTAVSDPSLSVRQAGIALLNRLDADAALNVIVDSLRPGEVPAMLEIAAGRADAAFDRFAAMAAAPDDDGRRAIALTRIARYMRHAGLARALVPLAGAARPDVRAALAELWAERPELAGSLSLESLARDPVTAVRRHAARAAAAARRYDVVAAMTADPDAETRRGVALLLAAAPDGEALAGLESDADAGVRAAAAVARILRGTADALPVDVRRADAADAVMDAAELAGGVAELRNTARFAPEERRRLAAALALAILGDPVAHELIHADPVPYVRGRVAAMLERHDAP